MTAKEYLEQARALESTIDRKIRLVNQLRELMTNPCGHLDGMPHSPSPNRQPIMDIVAEIADAERDIDADVDELIDVKRAIINALSMLAVPEHAKLLELRYLQFVPWDQVAAQMYYHVKHIPRIHARALEEVSPFLGLN